MGQSQTTPSRPPLVLSKSHSLYLSLSKTLPALSVEDYNTIFSSLAETDGSTPPYWKEDTLAKFLKVPAKLSSLLFKSASYLAALPSLEDVPALLTLEGLGIAVMVFTQQIPKEVLTTREVTRLLFNSFAEVPFNRSKETAKEGSEEKDQEKSGVAYGPQMSLITMTDLVLFFLTIITPHSITTLESTPATTTPVNRHSTLNVTKSILSAIQAYSKHPSSNTITYDSFRAFCERDAPYFFDALVPLFQKFLYDTKRWGDKDVKREDSVGTLMAERVTECMTMSTLAQLGLFLPKERRVGRLVGLYAGSKDGFSMGMFESKVLKYPGPSILLVKGTTTGVSSSTEKDIKEVIFGAYVSTPWKSSTKENFGDKSSILFQLLPTHTVYSSTPYHTQFAYFHPRVGLGFGSSPPLLPRRSSIPSTTLISHTSDPQVSLSIDSALEQAVFTHITPGSSFAANMAHGEYSYRIEVEEVEVWGCGVDDARDEQKRAWEWERREAERRQNVRVREDSEFNRALLEMAGIIGGNRSGGSM